MFFRASLMNLVFARLWLRNGEASLALADTSRDPLVRVRVLEGSLQRSAAPLQVKVWPVLRDMRCVPDWKRMVPPPDGEGVPVLGRRKHLGVHTEPRGGEDLGLLQGERRLAAHPRREILP